MKKEFPKPGKVERYIHEKIENEGALLLSLIDPADQPPEDGARMAKEAYEGGTDIILVGGSIGAQGEYLDKTVAMMRENVDVPIILFPGNIGTLTRYADAVYFMSMLNSRDVYWATTAQIASAPVVKELGIEPIPTTYLVIEPGGAVGWVGDARLLPRNKPYISAAAAMAGQFLGSRLIITDSGSGAPEPAPIEFIKAVASVCKVPYFYAGGVRKIEQAKNVIRAGADGIQIGTAFESEKDKMRKKVEEFVKAIKEEGKRRI